MKDKLNSLIWAVLGGVIVGVILLLVPLVFNQSPKLMWVETNSIYYAPDIGIFSEIDDLIEAATKDLKGDTRWDEKSRLRDLVSRSRDVVTISVDNMGGVSANDVSVFLSVEPIAFTIRPSIGVEKSITGNGLTELKLSSVDADSNVLLQIFGVSSSDIERVFYNGEPVRREFGRRLGAKSSDLILNLSRWGFAIFMVVSLIIYIFAIFISVYIENKNNELETKDDQISKNKPSEVEK